jgi:H+/Cl- antiporter ClcA
MWARVVYNLRFLPFELPSRKDADSDFIKKSAPYFCFGFLALCLGSFIVPGARNLPSAWLSNLIAPKDPIQTLLHAVLTLVCVWAASYAVGVLLIEKCRGYYRNYLVRPIEKHLKKVARTS